MHYFYQREDVSFYIRSTISLHDLILMIIYRSTSSSMDAKRTLPKWHIRPSLSRSSFRLCRWRQSAWLFRKRIMCNSLFASAHSWTTIHMISCLNHEFVLMNGMFDLRADVSFVLCSKFPSEISGEDSSVQEKRIQRYFPRTQKVSDLSFITIF